MGFSISRGGAGSQGRWLDLLLSIPCSKGGSHTAVHLAEQFWQGPGLTAVRQRSQTYWCPYVTARSPSRSNCLEEWPEHTKCNFIYSTPPIALPSLPQQDQEITIDDAVRGKVTWNTNTLGDFVILRSNGQPVRPLDTRPFRALSNVL